jgi:hypothetical protein
MPAPTSGNGLGIFRSLVSYPLSCLFLPTVHLGLYQLYDLQLLDWQLMKPPSNLPW